MMAARKTPSKGRAKGTKNKRTIAIEELLAAKIPGFNPILRMAEIANGISPCPRCHNSLGRKKKKNPDCGVCNGSFLESHSDEIKATMLKEVSQYIAPKRKAIEMSGNIHKVVHVTDLTGAKKRGS